MTFLEWVRHNRKVRVLKKKIAQLDKEIAWKNGELHRHAEILVKLANGNFFFSESEKAAISKVLENLEE